MARCWDFPEDLDMLARAPQIVASCDRGIGRWLDELAGLAGVPLPPALPQRITPRRRLV